MLRAGTRGTYAVHSLPTAHRIREAFKALAPEERGPYLTELAGAALTIAPRASSCRPSAPPSRARETLTTATLPSCVSRPRGEPSSPAASSRQPPSTRPYNSRRASRSTAASGRRHRSKSPAPCSHSRVMPSVTPRAALHSRGGRASCHTRHSPAREDGDGGTDGVTTRPQTCGLSAPGVTSRAAITERRYIQLFDRQRTDEAGRAARGFSRWVTRFDTGRQ